MAAEASFRISIDSISAGLMAESGLVVWSIPSLPVPGVPLVVKGIPSTI